MKKQPPASDSSVIQFPQPELGSAFAAVYKTTVPAFPLWDDGEAMRIAVPCLLVVPVPIDGNGIDEITAEAVRMVRNTPVFLDDSWKEGDESSGMQVECWSLSNSDMIRALPDAKTSERFLALLIEAAETIRESMRKNGESDPDEVEHVATETLGILHLLAAS